MSIATPPDLPRPLHSVTGLSRAQVPSGAGREAPGRLRPTRRPGLAHTPRAVVALIIREMSATYGRSPLGYLWAFLEPVAGIMLLSFVFSLGFKAPAIGTSFPLFYASGLMPFFIFSDISGKVAQSLKFNNQLLFYPRVTFLDAIIARLLLNGLTQIVVTILVIGSIVWSYDLRTIFDYPTMITSILMGVALGVGVGMINCYLFTIWPTWQRVWAIVTRPLVIVSCVVFVYDGIPQPFRDYLWWNPLVHVVGIMRRGTYPTYEAAYASPLYVFGLSGILTVLGLLLLQRYHRDIANA